MAAKKTPDKKPKKPAIPRTPAAKSVKKSAEKKKKTPAAPKAAAKKIKNAAEKPKVETRGEKNIRFIETLCIIPEGKHVGKPVKLAPFQRKFILDIYDNKHGTDTAILSIARKNAKTGLIAFIMLLHLVGPEAIENSRILSGAMSRDQAAEVYNLASKCISKSEKLSAICHLIPSHKKIIGLLKNVEYQAISADAHTAHGKSPVLAILDEVGQIRGATSDFVDAITTADGAYDNPLVIYISTQAPNDADFFSIMIDDYDKNKPPNTVCHVYAADADCDIMDESQWAKANPALGHFRTLKSIHKHAAKAQRMPSSENTFRNLILNQRVAVKSAFVTPTVWKMNGAPPLSLQGMSVYGGLDLSSRFDLTSLMLEGKDKDGICHVQTYAWTPYEGLIERSKRDRVPYDLWVRDGLLRTTPGHSVDYEYIARELPEILAGIDLKALYFDRHFMHFFEKALQGAGVTLPLEPHGQGFVSMAPALDALEADLVNSRVRHGMHPVLTMCAGNAVVTKDPAGNRKLDKARATGRIDCMVALAMAKTGTLGQKKQEQKTYQMFVL